MNITQIGLLLPTSTIFPVGKDYERGLKDGLGDTTGITITREFIASGQSKKVEEVLSKLFDFDEVDIVTGILSSRVTEMIAPVFPKNGKPFIVSELGEYLPDPRNMNDHIFINSQHLWQQARALGSWGVTNIGKNGMFIGGPYDAAYSFSHMFHTGMMAADSSAEWSFSIPPNPPAGQLADMSVIFPFIDQYKPDFIFAVFCGGETTLFLNEFIRRGYHKHIKVLGLPFLVTPFEPLADDITIYTTLPDASVPALAAKDSFYHLGYKAGALIAAANTEDGDILTALQNNPQTLRLGNAQYIIQPGAENCEIIVENRIKANSTDIEQHIIGTTPSLQLKYDTLESMQPEFKAGWLNPYLCI